MQTIFPNKKRSDKQITSTKKTKQSYYFQKEQGESLNQLFFQQTISGKELILEIRNAPEHVLEDYFRSLSRPSFNENNNEIDARFGPRSDATKRSKCELI